MKCFNLILFLFFISNATSGQRSYAANSVLASGNWYKLAVKETGIYKIDVAFLTSIGVSSNNLSSASIKLYSTMGRMLSESNSGMYVDDLPELSIEVVDGGDGLFNGNDYLLFYVIGTDYWLKDSINKKFIHQKNLYGNETYVYLTIGSSGKRVLQDVNVVSTNQINTYNERYFTEENLQNLINSGKEWVGKELSNLPGRNLTQNYSINLKNYILGSTIQLHSEVMARSGTVSRFEWRNGAQLIESILLPNISGGLLDLFVRTQQGNAQFIHNSNNLPLSANYVINAGIAQLWINYFELHYRASLRMNGTDPLGFRDWNSVGAGNVQFEITNVQNGLKVWNVTNPFSPLQQSGQLSGNSFFFGHDATQLFEYIAFYPNNIPTPIAKGTMPNQNLHNTSPVEYIIITTPEIKGEAEKLVAFHQLRNGIIGKVEMIDRIYNEFSGGIQDVSAIKEYLKMHYDRYRNNAIKLKSVLLLGDASFDYLNRINNNTNAVPTWQSKQSFDPLSSYCTDDFFGYLDDNEDINNSFATNLLDIGIGRLPVKNSNEAKLFIDKIFDYHDKKSLGAWRNQITLIADDEDGNLHLNDAEIMSLSLDAGAQQFIQNKLYLDAFRQQSGSGGSRYPDVNNNINNTIQEGTLIWNYNGHGGSQRLADEAILDNEMISSWRNQYKLPLFITATCDFAPFDNPADFSIGEKLLLQAKSGAIALMTTTRIVFAYSNRIINKNYLENAFQRNPNGVYPNLGEANRIAKNFTTTNGGDVINNQKFTLLGDPATTLAYPMHKVRTTKINNKTYAPFVDTLKATNLTTIEGEVVNQNNTLLNQLQGRISVTVFDKKQQISTLVNDPGSVNTTFRQFGNIIFKGNATVDQGKFTIQFIVPKDIQYNIGQGSISYYANNDSIDANGLDAITVGDNGTNVIVDNEGPIIKAYLNDTKFVNGSITNESPNLLVYLEDSSGINTSNIGIGHEITATIDNDTRNILVLNNYYQSDINNYKKGKLSVNLPNLAEGKHQILIKAWDVFNNSNTYQLDFVVGSSQKLVVQNVYNYPNPFTTSTQFWFEHNRPNEELNVLISIFSVSGKLVKQIKKTIINEGNRSCDIKWDGKDDFGLPLARGVYVYQLNVSNLKGEKIIKIEKLLKL